jgi:hypothetical protein
MTRDFLDSTRGIPNPRFTSKHAVSHQQRMRTKTFNNRLAKQSIDGPQFAYKGGLATAVSGMRKANRVVSSDNMSVTSQLISMIFDGPEGP